MLLGNFKVIVTTIVKGHQNESRLCTMPVYKDSDGKLRVIINGRRLYARERNSQVFVDVFISPTAA